MRQLLALIVATLVCSTANALTFGQFRAAKAHPQSGTWQATQAYLDGIQAGFDVGGRQMKDKGLKPFYCAPLSLNAENLADLVGDAFARTNGKNGITEDNSDIATALFFELQFRFPCGK